jgi:hypothetical protein
VENHLLEASFDDHEVPKLQISYADKATSD